MKSTNSDLALYPVPFFVSNTQASPKHRPNDSFMKATYDQSYLDV